MSDNNDPQQKNITGTPVPDSSSLQPTINATASDAEEKKKRRQQKCDEAADVFLKNIPVVGSYLAWVKGQFGWTGLSLLLAGTVVAVILAYIGLLPKWLISEGYKTAPLSQEDRGYELIAEPAEVLSMAFKNAQADMEVSAVALKAINLNTLKEKIEGDFRANIVVLDPCSDAVRRMPENTGVDSGASSNILNLLERLKNYWQLLPKGKKGNLQVRLSKRPATMVVAMFDHRRELYAYWCRYGAPCSKSHVLAFKHYGEKKPEYAIANQAGLLFENHYDAVFSDAEPLDLNAYDPNNPCPASSPARTVQP